MGCTCRNGRRRALHNLRGWSINSQRPAIVRAESHRATSKMHHFQPSDVYETGSSGWLGPRPGGSFTPLWTSAFSRRTANA